MPNRRKQAKQPPQPKPTHTAHPSGSSTSSKDFAAQNNTWLDARMRWQALDSRETQYSEALGKLWHEKEKLVSKELEQVRQEQALLVAEAALLDEQGVQDEAEELRAVQASWYRRGVELWCGMQPLRAGETQDEWREFGRYTRPHETYGAEQRLAILKRDLRERFEGWEAKDGLEERRCGLREQQRVLAREKEVVGREKDEIAELIRKVVGKRREARLAMIDGAAEVAFAEAALSTAIQEEECW